eukprot:NODE_1879_length_479_cov_230.644186_g1801_i0.p1 GENE.NODE_1879_length_479_cov_230.644186_g1801_i0~~NODE_1879_length_479_cov_230.644186_g1801_i0.p1  ORF type:complete len:80 (+),score=13.89 NODE_1879_length_479_cov_230.644186_g1801_i0:34-273(+)
MGTLSECLFFFANTMPSAQVSGLHVSMQNNYEKNWDSIPDGFALEQGGLTVDWGIVGNQNNADIKPKGWPNSFGPWEGI